MGYAYAKIAVSSLQAIIDLVTTIIVYKFSNLSREEIQVMLGLNLEEPRAILEGKVEGRDYNFFAMPKLLCAIADLEG